MQEESVDEPREQSNLVWSFKVIELQLFKI